MRWVLEIWMFRDVLVLTILEKSLSKTEKARGFIPGLFIVELKHRLKRYR